VDDNSTRRRLYSALKDFGQAAVLVVFFLAAHYYLSHRPEGRRFQEFESALIQDSLRANAGGPAGDYLPTIIDVSEMQGPQDAIDRKKLDELLVELNALGAKAIGIDADFSPSDHNQPIQADDWNYFAKWSHLKVRPRLGVYRRAGDSEDRWLGRSAFGAMAAGIARPIGDWQHNYYYMQHPGDPRLIQLAAGLFEDATGKPAPSVSNSWKPAPVKDLGGTDLTFGTYLIDYSALPGWRERTIRYRSIQDLKDESAQQLIRGNVVLIGDTSDAQDQLCSPLGDKPVSGVLFQAYSFATLAKQPLLEIDEGLSAKLDLSIVGLIGVLIYGVRIVQAFSPRKPQVDYHNLEILLCGTFAILLLVLSRWYIGTHRVFWPDFLWVSAGLFLHPFFSGTFWRFWASIALGLYVAFLDFVRRKEVRHAN